jgi:hypothetical protein
MLGGASGNIPDGPYTGMGTLLSIQELVRSEHQCLLAEVSFDLDPIPGSADPSNNDKLAQRNLSFGPAPNPGLSDSRRVPQTFEVRPTPFFPLHDIAADELMIEWDAIPAGSRAQLYFPAVLADEILSLAARTFTSHLLTKIDVNTIECPAAGVTYVPIPRRLGPNFAGLLTLSLPDGIKKGQTYGVTVKQVTSVIGRRSAGTGHGNDVGHAADGSAANILSTTATKQLRWRRVLGVFHLRIPVGTKESLLPFEERRLSIMRHIGRSIPTDNRWYKVFHRYLEQLAGRVRDMGGNPDAVVPDPNGDWNGRIQSSHGVPDQRHVHLERVGKIGGLFYNRFGNFDGFVLETDHGEHRFESRERDVESVVRAAWIERTLIAVFADPRRPECVESILLIGPPDLR